MLDHFFPLLFPKDSESLKILEIRLWEVGAKIPLNGTSKVNRRTDGQTHRRKFQLIESIGPEGRCFENPAYGRHQISRPMRIVAPILLFPLVSKKGLIEIASRNDFFQGTEATVGDSFAPLGPPLLP